MRSNDFSTAIVDNGAFIAREPIEMTREAEQNALDQLRNLEVNNLLCGYNVLSIGLTVLFGMAGSRAALYILGSAAAINVLLCCTCVGLTLRNRKHYANYERNQELIFKASAALATELQQNGYSKSQLLSMLNNASNIQYIGASYNATKIRMLPPEIVSNIMSFLYDFEGPWCRLGGLGADRFAHLINSGFFEAQMNRHSSITALDALPILAALARHDISADSPVQLLCNGIATDQASSRELKRWAKQICDESSQRVSSQISGDIPESSCSSSTQPAATRTNKQSARTGDDLCIEMLTSEERATSSSSALLQQEGSRRTWGERLSNALHLTGRFTV